MRTGWIFQHQRPIETRQESDKDEEFLSQVCMLKVDNQQMIAINNKILAGMTEFLPHMEIF